MPVPLLSHHKNLSPHPATASNAVPREWGSPERHLQYSPLPWGLNEFENEALESDKKGFCDIFLFERTFLQLLALGYQVVRVQHDIIHEDRSQVRYRM